MSIASEITRINGNIAAAYTALDGKGATLPASGSQNSANLADTIDTITAGGGGGGDDFDSAAFYAKVNAMNNILTVRSGEYNSTRMERALQNGFIQKKADISNLDAQWFYVLQLKYETKCITFKPYSTDESIAFWVPAATNVYTSDGLGKTTNNSDTSEKRVTIEFTGDEDRTVIIGTAAGNGCNLTQGLFRVFESLNAPSAGKDYHSEIRACHVYLPAYEKNQAAASSTYGSVLNTSQFSNILGSAKIFSFDHPTNTWNKLSSETIYSLSDFNHSLTDTSVFAEIYSSAIFDADLGVFKLPADQLSSLESYISRYTQVYSFGSDNGLFPFLLDFSNRTSTSKITFGGYTQLASASSFGRRMTTIYIKLPSNADVDMSVYDGGATNAHSSPQLTYKSWQYLANNAPSVSGKTLNVGYQFYNWAKTLQIPCYKTITDALETKGWTIAQ